MSASRCYSGMSASVTGISDEPSETIVIRNVTRHSDDMYECVASNGVPPAAVRRIRVTVECQYTQP